MNTVKSIIMLCGAINFGQLASTMLHEFGHAVVSWATGGTVYRIVLNHYDLSYASCTAQEGPAEGMMLLGGAAFAVIVGLLLVGLGLEIRSPYLLPFTITGLLALFVNGVYYLGWRDPESNGDPARLIHDYGWPDWSITLLALFFLLMALVSLPRIAPLLGISPGDSIWKRWLVLLGGCLPYLVGILSYYDLLDLGHGLLPLLVWAGAGLVLWIVAGFSCLGQDKEAPVARFGVAPLIYSLGMGILPFLVPMEYVFTPF
ncbi:MAG TPA: M50 family metallopeptidase [Anaerolineaceae bacterium]|nr:M50 family metallopeptidase [Anaerolineaceae bacterium]